MAELEIRIGDKVWVGTADDVQLAQSADLAGPYSPDGITVRNEPTGTHTIELMGIGAKGSWSEATQDAAFLRGWDAGYKRASQNTPPPEPTARDFTRWFLSQPMLLRERFMTENGFIRGVPPDA